MPWKECSVMDERLQFVARRLAGEPMAELCRKFGISRKTGYKIFDRYQECGVEGLTDRSRRPFRYANQLPFRLDLGNNADSGQFVLGEPLNRRNRRHRLRLRTVSELFPEVIQGELDGDSLPSCSAAEALDRQEPFVNPTLANHALALLARLFRYGMISCHGGFVSLSSLSSVQALRVDPKHWGRLRNRGRHSKDL
jgi:hypothetical protein